MGHTVTSQRMAIDIILEELKAFGDGMRKEDRMLLEKILNEPLKHVGAMSNASSINIWALILLSVLLEHQRRLKALEAHP
jgi:hypothetical protein